MTRGKSLGLITKLYLSVKMMSPSSSDFIYEHLLLRDISEKNLIKIEGGHVWAITPSILVSCTKFVNWGQVWQIRYQNEAWAQGFPLILCLYSLKHIQYENARL